MSDHLASGFDDIEVAERSAVSCGCPRVAGARALVTGRERASRGVAGRLA